VQAIDLMDFPMSCTNEEAHIFYFFLLVLGKTCLYIWLHTVDITFLFLTFSWMLLHCVHRDGGWVASLTVANHIIQDYIYRTLATMVLCKIFTSIILRIA